ncbi:threonine/homoserine/homoserine lactone efflux protein [Metabacillus crassostreae]|uniref:LysE family transporter n=1 Tax=Metabacillus crassostreae TaxID=929098 RepID=UPI0019584336|nr:LysE family transporter [Metabacillus crassostreae]MBM7602950.1 threonine/homoserine/homoserine lactone efflux protein [Metabacillus crassostreae]
MSILLSYVLLGLSLAAPIGPVNAAQIDRGFRFGFYHSWVIGLGSVTADIIYMIMVYMGVVNFLDSPFMQTFLWLFGFFVLIYTGIETIFSARKEIKHNRSEYESYFKTFMTGFFMSLSNPLTILFWLGIYGSVLAKTAATYENLQLFIYSGAILIGLLLWDFTMAIISSTFRKILTPGLIAFISVISGLTLIGFGVYFGLQAYHVLF